MVLTREKGGSPTVKPSWRDRFADAYVAEDAAFIRCIVSGREPEVTGFDGMMAVKAVNAGNRSIKIKKPVKIKLKQSFMNPFYSIFPIRIILSNASGSNMITT